MKKRLLTATIIVALAVLLSLLSTNPRAPITAQAAESLQPNRQGGWLDSMVFSEQGDIHQAVTQLQADELDLYAYPVADPDIYQTVLEDPNLSQSEAYQLYYELTFNPSGPTFTDGRLNPFSNAKIREAMNWLIDREKITQEIFGGISMPLYTVITQASADFGRFKSTIDGLEASYAYNLSQAQAAITTEMEAMGAILTGGIWYYNGEPVTVIFIIRIEDERRLIGDYVSDQLEAIGFTVDRQYMTRTQASPIWNQSDPAEGQWHIYTGGWITTSISRDDSSNFGYFYTPFGSGSPLWQAYNPTPEFEALCWSLWINDFTNLAERSTLFEQALMLSMNDSGTGSEGSGSLRVWLVHKVGFAPRRAEVIVANDLARSVSGAEAFPFVARFDGVEGGGLRMAQPGLLVEPWNPIAGSTWSYDTFPIRATADSGLLADPNTGLYWPLRIENAEVVVREGLPVTKTLDWVTLTTTDTIEVPGEAWVDWDATDQVFVTASEKYTYTLTANSKVTVHYPADLFTTVTWHDGSPISMGDFVMNMIMRFDPAKPDSLIYDESQVPAFDVFLSHFKGLVIESTDPLVITTYDDQYFLDAEAMVQAWYPMGGVYSYGNAAWHTLTPAVRAEEAEELAFSADKAGQLGVEWTNFIGGASLDILENWMDQSTIDHYIPYLPTMAGFVPLAEADARWSALQTWYAGYHHFWLGTGPFYVQQVSYDPKSLTLAHFDAYPDASGRWDAFAAPAQPELLINHASGAPGSYFNVTGTGFPPESLATIVANDHILDHLMVDSSGSISFTLSTDQADPGVYHLRVSVNPAAGVQFTLDEAQPLLPREGELPIIPIPGGLIIYPTLLPLISRNHSQGQLYFDDFSDPNSGWYVGKGDVYSFDYLEGEYQMTIEEAGWIVDSTAPIAPLSGNYSVEADIHRSTGMDIEYGISFERDQDWWGYFFFVKPETQTYSLRAVVNDNVWVILSSGTSSFIHPGDAINHLKAERNGSQVIISVNGQVLASVNNTIHQGGRLALAVWSHSYLPAIALFDNFEVRLPVGAPASSVMPAPGQGITIPAFIPEAKSP